MSSLDSTNARKIDQYNADFLKAPGGTGVDFFQDIKANFSSPTYDYATFKNFLIGRYGARDGFKTRILPLINDLTISSAVVERIWEKSGIMAASVRKLSVARAGTESALVATFMKDNGPQVLDAFTTFVRDEGLTSSSFDRDGSFSPQLFKDYLLSKFPRLSAKINSLSPDDLEFVWTNTKENLRRVGAQGFKDKVLGQDIVRNLASAVGQPQIAENWENLHPLLRGVVAGFLVYGAYNGITKSVPHVDGFLKKIPLINHILPDNHYASIAMFWVLAEIGSQLASGVSPTGEATRYAKGFLYGNTTIEEYRRMSGRRSFDTKDAEELEATHLFTGLVLSKNTREAINLTHIKYDSADADVQRAMDKLIRDRKVKNRVEAAQYILKKVTPLRDTAIQNATEGLNIRLRPNDIMLVEGDRIIDKIDTIIKRKDSITNIFTASNEERWPAITSLTDWRGSGFKVNIPVIGEVELHYLGREDKIVIQSGDIEIVYPKAAGHNGGFDLDRLIYDGRVATRRALLRNSGSHTQWSFESTDKKGIRHTVTLKIKN